FLAKAAFGIRLFQKIWLNARLFGGQFRPRDKSVMNRLAPARFKVPPVRMGLPVFGNDVVVTANRLSLRERAEDLVRGLPVIQRRDQWLLKRYCSVERPRITPGFEIVGLRDVPGAARAGFIQAEPDMHAPPHLLQQAAELQVGGR